MDGQQINGVIKAMKRREFIGVCALGSATSLLANPNSASTRKHSKRNFHIRDFELSENEIPELQHAMERGRERARSIAAKYLERIDQIDRSGPELRAVIELNPDALKIARELDRERKAKGPRGPLHGIPVLLKDNIDTHDRMTTTAGSLALEGSIPSRDSFVAERLRAAGAVILGKTNLSEWANFRSNHSTSGWSGRGGLTRNPYALDRNTSGSSSGSAAAVSANLCSVAVGTETDGSIISPSSYCGLVGLKPTVGLISRSGIIPISSNQDTAGPMTRTVRDAAILLGALSGPDDRDPITRESRGKGFADYTQFLDGNGLRGARIGIARQFFHFKNNEAKKVMETAIEALKNAGAEIIDPANIPSEGQNGGSEYLGMLFEFKDGLNKYFQTLGPKNRVRTLKDLIAFNEENKEREMPYFGQEILIQAEEKGPLTEEGYLEAVKKNRRLSRDEGIDLIMDKEKLDVIVAPSGGPAHRTDFLYGDRDTGGSSSPAPVAGYPSITVPAGYVTGLPLGISFFGRAYSEPLLLKLAYSFEQTTKFRKTPQFLPSVGES